MEEKFSRQKSWLVFIIHLAAPSRSPWGGGGSRRKMMSTTLVFSVSSIYIQYLYNSLGSKLLHIHPPYPSLDFNITGNYCQGWDLSHRSTQFILSWKGQPVLIIKLHFNDGLTISTTFNLARPEMQKLKFKEVNYRKIKFCQQKLG